MSGEPQEENELLPSSEPSLPDVRVEVKIKNNLLWDAIHDRYSSVSAFCKTYPSLRNRESRVGELLGFKCSPFKRDGEYKDICLLVSNALSVSVDKLFPIELYKKFLKERTSGVIEVYSFNALPAPDQKILLQLPAPEMDVVDEIESSELKEKIQEVLCALTYREATIIMMRYGLEDGHEYTVDECAEIFKVSCGRIRQIQAKALRKIRNNQSEKLRPFTC